MINKLGLSVILLSAFICGNAQTGPGGVGSSATNVFWFDANKGVATVGPNVTGWADQSGNGITAAPPAANARPTLVGSSVNGNSSIDFDGGNDELWVPDANSLDLTAWHFYIVAIVDGAKDYNAWLSKGNDGQENFEMLSYSTNNIHAPVYWSDVTRTFPSTGNNQLNTATFEIIEYSYVSTAGRDIYRNYTNVYTDNESKTPQINAFDMYIGNEKTTSRFIDGDLAEVIGYNTVLNNAQRIIVNNYLAAKFNRTLGSNDLYTMDNGGNGNYDYEVGGIGRVDVSNTHIDSRGGGIVRINNPRGLGNNEFLFWGHNNAITNSNETSDVPPGVGSRMMRVWRVSENSEVGNIDISVDLTGLGSVTVTDLRLLIDTDNDGVFTDEAGISGAVALGSNVYQWVNVDLDDARRFSFGTSNTSQTPMPVELTEFYASPENNKVDINWITATEKNNDRFEVEKSEDGITFNKFGESLSKASTGGNSFVELNYSYTDAKPYSGTSYYRLKQVDKDGKYEYSPIISVAVEATNHVRFTIFPNPNKGEFSVDFTGVENEHEITIEIFNMAGKNVFKNQFTSESMATNTVHIVPEEKLESGQYIVNFSVEGIRHPIRVIVE